MSEPLPELTRLGIGKVLEELHGEFPELTITKIRYLESEGLIEPERTAAGYRKFTYGDVERLRFILRQQRDKFWPLSHIRQVLDDMGNGVVPPQEVGDVVAVPHLTMAVDGLPDESTFDLAPSRVRLSRAELLDSAGIDEDVLDAAEEHGLVQRRSAKGFYDGPALQVAALLGELAKAGLEPRHLRMFRAAADREVAMIDQIVPAAARQQGRQDALETVAALGALTVRLHTLLVKNGLRP